MDVVKQLMLDVVVAASGIHPMRNTLFDMNKEMASLPAEEQRALKRKFRKQWRKAAKKRLRETTTPKGYRRVSDDYGLGLASDQRPTKKQKSARKVAVWYALTMAADRLVGAAHVAALNDRDKNNESS